MNEITSCSPLGGLDMDAKEFAFTWTLAQSKEVNKALAMVNWLKQQGLENNNDFMWSLNPNKQATIFIFMQDKEMYGSFLALKFT